MSWAEALTTGELVPLGRLRESSNLALVCSVAAGSVPLRCVYKPVSGERPLWDFPGTALAAREVLTAQVAAALGWDVVPVTVWRTNGPMGPGMCQEWVDDTGPPLVLLVDPAERPTRWLTVASGRSAADRPVVLTHADDPQLQRLAVLDVLVNNADRKGGHVLHRADGRVAGIDHGLTFHAEAKLRTVLWGWVGDPVPDEALSDVERSRDACAGLLDAGPFRVWFSDAERAAFRLRIDRLLARGTFPEPGADWPTLPWPLI